MNREEMISYINENYNSNTDFPWAKHPSYQVFRHIKNKKWFAVIMTIPKNKLGLESDENVDIVNLKCDTALIDGLIKEEGIFPAYHMNKKHWVSVALDGSCLSDKIKMLLDISFNLTKK